MINGLNVFVSQKLQNISRKLQIISDKSQDSGKFQNNVINDAKKISSNSVIKLILHYFCMYVIRANSTSNYTSINIYLSPPS